MSFYSSEYLRTAYEEWFKQQPFELAVTINANQKLTLQSEHHVLEVVDAKLNRTFLGRHFSRLAESERIALVGVPEHKLKGVHFHLAVRIPVSIALDIKRTETQRALDILLKAPRNGRRLLPGASIDVRYADAKWISYVLKGLQEQTTIYIRGVVSPQQHLI